MIELQLDGDAKYGAEARGRTAWRLESSLREFRNIMPVDFWFDYPLHALERSADLSDAPAKGSMAAERTSEGKNLSREQRAESMTRVGFWNDDAQVCREVVTKRWTRTRPGLRIEVTQLDG